MASTTLTPRQSPKFPQNKGACYLSHSMSHVRVMSHWYDINVPCPPDDGKCPIRNWGMSHWGKA